MANSTPSLDEWLNALRHATGTEGRRDGGGFRFPCPAHGGEDFNLRIAPGDVVPVVAWCWSHGCTYEEICASVGLDNRTNAPRSPQTPLDGPLRALHPRPTTLTIARGMFDTAVLAPGTKAAIYLGCRGVPELADCPTLRYAARCRHLDGTFHPALIAAAILDGRFAGVQRTWLRADGTSKAALDPPRASLGSTKGAAVRLRDPLDGRLLVAEGVETAGAAAKVLGWESGVWATLGTSGLAAVVLPGAVRHVCIAADRDRSGAGLRAAAELGSRIEANGRRVEIHVPDSIGLDFADVLAEVAR